MTGQYIGALALVVVVFAVWLWAKERKARSWPARRRAGYQARIHGAETPGQAVTVAAEYLAATLQHVPTEAAAWAVARAHAHELTEAADALTKYVPKKEGARR